MASGHFLLIPRVFAASFIKPGTATQLGAGCLISLFFLVLHMGTNGYVKPEEDTLQFVCMLTVTLTLFSGLLLKAQESAVDSGEQSTPYEQGLMAFMLIFINVGVVALTLYQASAAPPFLCHHTWCVQSSQAASQSQVVAAFLRGPVPNQMKLQRKVRCWR